jgi:uncharacterized protein DUF3500
VASFSATKVEWQATGTNSLRGNEPAEARTPFLRQNLRSMKAARLLVGALVLAGPGTPAPEPALTNAAKAFLDALDAGKRAKAVLPFNSDQRLDWHYVPRSRPGVSYGQMSPPEREAAVALLKASLSAMGFEKVEAIRRLEEVLFAMSGSPTRDPERYAFVVFGEPSAQGAWGWRYEGHHLSLNWTVLDGRLVSSTPQFLGANPADVREGPQKERRALAAEEDLGRALVRSLRPDQLESAVVDPDAPGDILTGASRIAAIQEDMGIPFEKLDAQQQGLFLSLVEAYASTQTPAEAQARLARIRADLPRVKFAWMGSLDKGRRHYYRIQGSTDLIEYDNTQDGANHIHCVWRVFDGDWGRDLLAEHYRTSPHGVR